MRELRKTFLADLTRTHLKPTKDTKKWTEKPPFACSWVQKQLLATFTEDNWISLWSQLGPDWWKPYWNGYRSSGDASKWLHSSSSSSTSPPTNPFHARLWFIRPFFFTKTIVYFTRGNHLKKMIMLWNLDCFARHLKLSVLKESRVLARVEKHRRKRVSGQLLSHADELHLQMTKWASISPSVLKAQIHFFLYTWIQQN